MVWSQVPEKSNQLLPHPHHIFFTWLTCPWTSLIAFQRPYTHLRVEWDLSLLLPILHGNNHIIQPPRHIAITITRKSFVGCWIITYASLGKAASLTASKHAYIHPLWKAWYQTMPLWLHCSVSYNTLPANVRKLNKDKSIYEKLNFASL